MKRILVLLCLMYASYANAQTVSITADGDPISATKIIKTDTLLKKKFLYSLGTEWFVNVFNNPKMVMQMQDSDVGIIIGKCSLTYMDTLNLSFLAPTTYPTTEVDYMIKLSFKDGKIKYDIYDFITKAGTAIKIGNIILGPIPNTPMVNKKKLENFYKHSYANAQSAYNTECLLIGTSITDYFLKQRAKNDW